jgi:hypothetical protein
MMIPTPSSSAVGREAGHDGAPPAVDHAEAEAGRHVQLGGDQAQYLGGQAGEPRFSFTVKP